MTYNVDQKGSVGIGIAVAVLAIAFTVWYVFYKPEAQPVPKAPGPVATTTSMNLDGFDMDSSIVEKAIQNAPYRVIAVYTPPKAKFQVHIATERKPNCTGASCGSVDCGSIYSTPTCYFFIEPKYEYGAPDARYIGKLVQPGLLELESLEMQDDRYLYFTTREADGDWGFIQDWQLDLQTSEFKKLKRTETHAEM